MCAFRFGNSRGVTVTKFVIVPVVGRLMMWIIFFVLFTTLVISKCFFFYLFFWDRTEMEKNVQTTLINTKKKNNAAFQSHVDDSLLAE